LTSLLPFLDSSIRWSEVDDDEGEGSVIFLNVRVQENSSPEKKAESGNEGNTLMFDMPIGRTVSRNIQGNMKERH